MGMSAPAADCGHTTLAAKLSHEHDIGKMARHYFSTPIVGADLLSDLHQAIAGNANREGGSHARVLLALQLPSYQ